MTSPNAKLYEFQIKDELPRYIVVNVGKFIYKVASLDKDTLTYNVLTEAYGVKIRAVEDAVQKYADSYATGEFYAG